MRIAILADIHGNIPAFEAALTHCRAQTPDLIILAGDVVNAGPDSRDCWQLAKTLNCPIIRGNHERYVARYGTPLAPPEWSTERFGPVRWSYQQMSQSERSELEALPLSWSSAEVPDIYFCHSSARNDADLIAPYTPVSELDAMFPQIEAQLVIRGHNHAPAVHLWGERKIVTSGSVGLTLDGIPTAQYVLITNRNGGWVVEHQSVPYDVDAAVQRFVDSGYLAEAGPMARLFHREVATASFQVVPFMRMYERWLAECDITLADAVSRFLGCP